MNQRTVPIPLDQISGILSGALAARPEAIERNTIQFHNLGLLRERLSALRGAFPPQTLHAVAIKANPLVALMRELVDAGAGLEAASMEEVHCALAAGCPPQRLIFDSPAKTRAEIARSLELGLTINLDNFDELARVADAIGDEPVKARIGFRVNPEVGAGDIAITSVSTQQSKFGISISRDRDALIDAMQRYPWLNALHIHVGSQGCSLEQLVAAAKAIMGLREDIHESLGEERIGFLDIGGGLPFPYTDADRCIPFESYAEALKQAAPALFDPALTLATEFGRVLHAGCGWTATRIEYVKTDHGRALAVCHAGADLLMRPVYQPQTWRHRYSLLDKNGAIKSRLDDKPWTIAGPLCFAGDLIARDIALPEPEEGDWLIVHDTGAYTLSMWSRHCSRALPPVFGYENESQQKLIELFAGEKPEDVVKFWS